MNSQGNSPNNILPLHSKKKSGNSNAAVSSILKGILDARTIQQENPIIDYIEED